MKSTLNRTLSIVLVLGLLFTLIPMQAYATSFANNSVEPANYTSGVTSVAGLTERLESLIAKYKNTYWTSTGSACSAHGTDKTCYSKYYYGWQCKGFASYIFNDLFCGGYIGAYDSGYYYIPSPSNATLIGKYTDVSSTDGTTVKNLLSQAKPGDFIQAHRRGKSYGHSMIVTSVDSNGVYLFDCNSDGHCKVQHYYQTWSTFASKNDDFSLYRSTKYPSASGGSTGSTTSHTANSAYSGCLPIYSYPFSTGSIAVYDVNGSAYSNRYIIGSTDLCIIREIYTDGWCYVSYPSSAETDGYFEAYVPLSTFISSPPSSLTSWTSTGNYTAYRRSDLADKLGSVSNGDSCKVVATSGNLKQVIYPVTGSGYWKMGWINVGSTATTTDSDFPTPILAYNYSADTKTTVYQYVSTLGGTSYGTIFVDDLCTLNSVSISGNWINVTYPVSSGTKTGYVYLNQFFPSLGNISKPYSTKVSANTTAYRKADMATSIGTVYPSDTITVVGKSGNLYQVLYPVTTGTNAGKYKLGWIYGDNIVKNLVSIAVTTKPTKTVYLEGESFSSSGMVVTATYDDGSTAAVTGYTVSGYTSTPGSKTITITYGGKTTAIDVTVKSKSPTALTITTKPSDTSYFVGEDFNAAGMVVKATYDNGTTANVTDYYVSYDFSSAGTKTVTVAYQYNGKTVSTTLSVTVVNPTISSIAVATKPTKTSYYVGDTLNTSGLTLTASYNDGSTETVSSGFTCSPTTLSTAGTQTITVSYGGKTTTFTVTVTAVTLSSISVATMPTKTSYSVGDTLDTTGLTLTASYNNGTTKTITSGFTCSPTNLNTAGTQKITVTYGGLTTSFNVVVLEVPSVSFSVGEVCGDPGETIRVPVSLTANEGIIAARLKISYPSVLTLEKVEDCGILGEYVFGNDLTSNPYIIMWENGLAASDYTETGVLVYLTFRISADAAAGAYDIEITYDAEEIYNIDLTNANVSISNGSVLVGHSYEDGKCTICGQVAPDQVPVGWVQEDGTWYYYQDGAPVTGWLKDGNYWYYLDSTGAMTTGWVKVGSNWFYMNQNGVMMTGWQKINGYWYYFASGGAMQTGWVSVGGKWYYMASGGAMQTGWVSVGGKWYYMDPSGAMQTGWITVGNYRYYLDSKGVMQTGWIQLDGTWYYLTSSGAMATGWTHDGSYWYYMDEDGIMRTGWITVNGKWYYLNKSGVMQTGWLKDGGYWYYLDATGAMVTGTQVIDGKTYVFNKSGVWIG